MFINFFSPVRTSSVFYLILCRIISVFISREALGKWFSMDAAHRDSHLLPLHLFEPVIDLHFGDHVRFINSVSVDNFGLHYYNLFPSLPLDDMEDALSIFQQLLPDCCQSFLFHDVPPVCLSRHSFLPCQQTTWKLAWAPWWRGVHVSGTFLPSARSSC